MASDSPKETSKKRARTIQIPQTFEFDAKRHKAFVDFANRAGDSAKSKAKVKAKSPAKVKYTPLEKQVVALQQKHPNVILFVEVGYKYRVFGDDARTVANLLDIYCSQQHNFLTCSIPVHRLYIHIQRVIGCGHKVGVVRQVEKAASKKQAKSSGPFERELVEVYTKATWVPADVRGHGSQSRYSAVSMSRASTTKFIVCVDETASPASEISVNKVNVVLLAVDPVSAEVVWDTFEDGFMRYGLEARLLKLTPSVLLLPGEEARVSSHTDMVLQQYCRTHEASIERLDSQQYPLEPSVACARLSVFFESRGQKDLAVACRQPTFLAKYSLPPALVTCYAALAEHLKYFKVDAPLTALQHFHHLSGHGHMSLDANALQNLQVLETDAGNNQRTQEGSLWQLICHTKTHFGKRTLRKWLVQPLIDRHAITQRLEAVSALRDLTGNGDSELRSLRPLLELLPKLPDLERGLARSQYGRVTPPEVAGLLHAFESVLRVTPATPLVKDCIAPQSALLGELCQGIDAPDLRVVVSECLEMLKPDLPNGAAMHEIWRSDAAFPALREALQAISDTKTKLQAELVPVRKRLGPEFSRLEYKTINGSSYLVEVPKKHIHRVPKDWMIISGTQKANRYHTPTIQQLMHALELHQEQLQDAGQAAWKAFLMDFNQKYAVLRAVVGHLASIDALQSLACVAGFDNYVCPEINDTGQFVVKQGRHPMCEQAMNDAYVPNDIQIGGDGLQCMVITGPNMGGKSSYIRQMALISIMAQIGSFVPAESVSIDPFDAVFTRMGARDMIEKQQSSFLVELAETSGILKSATPRSLVILDELGRGTSTHDGMAIAYATLQYILETVRCPTLFVTHYPLLSDLSEEHPGLIDSFHMAFVTERDTSVKARFLEQAELLQPVTFLYQLVNGVCQQSYGLNVARLADLPDEVRTSAANKSALLRTLVEGKKDAAILRQVLSLLHSAQDAPDVNTSSALTDLRALQGSLQAERSASDVGETSS